MPPKDFISIKDWPDQGLKDIFTICRQLKLEHAQGIAHNHLSRRNIGLIFEKASLRTRVSFEVGINQLGGSAIVLGDKVGRIGEREPVSDLARVSSRYLDALVVRTYQETILRELASFASIPVINALSDESHPCQAMGDIYTLMEKWGDVKGRILVYVGDSNNVALSLLQIASRMGLTVRIASPQGYTFPQRIIKWGLGKGFEFTNDPVRAVKGAHVIYTDVWTSMGQEEEREKRLVAFKGFQVNMKLLKKAEKDVLLMHCLPAHRGEEIDHEALESRHSIVFDQAENRLHIQKAILVRLIWSHKK